MAYVGGLTQQFGTPDVPARITMANLPHGDPDRAEQPSESRPANYLLGEAETAWYTFSHSGAA